MHNYERPQSWYEPDVDPDDRYCRNCNYKQETIDDAAEYLLAIVNQLYSKKPLDLVLLENDLDGLCTLLDVKLMSGDLQISRKKSGSLPFVEDWINYNEDQLKILAK